MKILICTMAVVLLCSCSSIKNDGNLGGSQLSDSSPALETSEESDPVRDFYFEKTSLYDVLIRKQRKYAYAERELLSIYSSLDELGQPLDSTTKLLRTSRVPSGSVLDYGFCFGEGWGMNIRGLSQAEDSRRLDADVAAYLDPEARTLRVTERSFEGSIEGSFEEIIARLAKQAGIKYLIQSGIDVGTLKIPSTIGSPISAIITICRYYDLQMDLSANEVKIFNTRE